jgi:hypothetical protein
LRLLGSACASIIPQMLTYDESAPENDFWPMSRAEFRAMYYFPALTVRRGVVTTEEWELTIASDGRVSQTQKVRVRTELYPLMWGGYYNYPFDRHELNVAMDTAPKADLNRSCTMRGTQNFEARPPIPEGMDMFAPARNDQVDKYALPPGGEWRSEGVRVEGHGRACELRLFLRRSPWKYFQQDFVLDVIVTLAGMTALFLDPTVPPLLGGRCSLLIVALLIVMNGFKNRDLGVGHISELVRIDFFTLFCATLLACGLWATVAVHMLWRKGSIFHAREADWALRTLLCFGIAPNGFLFFYLWLQREGGLVPSIVLIVGLTLVSGVVAVQAYQDTVRSTSGTHTLTSRARCIHHQERRTDRVRR